MDDSCCTVSFLPYLSFAHITKAGTSVLSAPQVPSQRRELAIISILISHPTEGLILYETGGGKDYPTVVSVNLISLVSLKPVSSLPAPVSELLLLLFHKGHIPKIDSGEPP